MKAKRRPKAAHAVDTPNVAATHRCRECDKVLSAPKPIRRGVCRACRRAIRAVSA